MLLPMPGKAIAWLLSQPLFWACIGIVLGPYLFVRGFRLLQRKRLIMDTPRSTVRAAALGLVEIQGRTTGPYTLVSPIASRECFYYRVVIRARAHTIVDEMCAPLFLDDSTGRLLVYPQGAELQFPPTCSLDFRHGSNTASDYLRHLLARHGYSIRDLESAQEFCIASGDLLFVLGILRHNEWQRERSGQRVDSATRIGAGFVGRVEAEVQVCQAVPSVASGPGRTASQLADGEFDLHPPVLLMRGVGPFVISTKSERDVISGLGGRSMLYIWGGPLITILSAYVIMGWLAGRVVLPFN